MLETTSNLNQSSENFAYYRAFGLTIASEIILPQVLPALAPADVYVRYGRTPKALAEVQASASYFQMNQNQFLLFVNDVADYFIENGREIIVETVSGADEYLIQAFLLTTAFAALLHQRGALMLHASVIEMQGEAVLIVGVSGAGKSTTAASLMRKAYRLLADDIAVIDFDAEARPFVYPAFPQQNLWKDSLNYFNESIENLKEIAPKPQKYVLPVKDLFWDKPLAIRAIYILDADTDELRLEPINGIWRIQALAAHIYREQFLNKESASISMMKQITGLAQQVSIKRLYRPKNTASHEAIVKLLEEDLAR